MTAVTVEYRSRRPEIETEIFCPVCLRPRFGLYVRIGFPARIEHRNIIRETYRTEVGHAAVSVFSEEGLLRFPEASSRRTRVFCRSFISGVRKSVGYDRSGNVVVHSGYEDVAPLFSFAPDFSAGPVRLFPFVALLSVLRFRLGRDMPGSILSGYRLTGRRNAQALFEHVDFFGIEVLDDRNVVQRRDVRMKADLDVVVGRVVEREALDRADHHVGRKDRRMRCSDDRVARMDFGVFGDFR